MEKQRILLRIGNSRSQKPPNSIWMSTNWISFFSTISPFIQDSQSSRATEMKTANRITNKTTIYPNYLQSKTQQFITSTRDTCPRYSCDNPFFFHTTHKMDCHSGMVVSHKANIWYISHTMYLVYQSITSIYLSINAAENINLNSENHIYK
jgi:hypothetical protein